MVDVGAVMDAVGSDRAVVYGASESGSLATLFAASHPERTSALVLHGSFPSGSWEPDAPWGYTKEYFAERLDMIERAWGTEEYVRWEFPTFTDERLIRWVASYLRRSASPGAVLAWDRMDYETDVRDVLGAIHVPTLILHREEDAPEANRYLAEHTRGPTTWRSPAASTCPAWATSTPCCARSRPSCAPSVTRRPNSTGCSRPCSSPTSSTRPPRPPRWVTSPGRRSGQP